MDHDLLRWCSVIIWSISCIEKAWFEADEHSALWNSPPESREDAILKTGIRKHMIRISEDLFFEMLVVMYLVFADADENHALTYFIHLLFSPTTHQNYGIG